MKPLTARQREALLLAAGGLTNAAIGTRLGLHRNTVERRLATVYRTLGAQDRAHAVALAIWRGDISLGQLAVIAGQATDRDQHRGAA